MKLAAVDLPPEIGEDASIVRRGLEAPAPLVQTLRREVHGVVAELKAGLRGPGEGAEGAALELRFGAAVGEAVLHSDVARPTERVQPEHRVVGPQIGAVDGDGRNEVPVD